MSAKTYSAKYMQRHHTLLQLVVNWVFITGYLGMQEYVIIIYKKKCRGHVVKKIFR